MAGKIGLSFQAPLSAVELERLAGLAPWAGWKSIDELLPLQVAQVAGVPIRVLRSFDMDALDSGPAVARLLSMDLRPATHIQLANESPRCADAAWQSAVTAGLRAGGYAGAVLGGGFATGNPSLWISAVGHAGPHFPDWTASPLRNIMSTCAAPGALALNQYFYTKPSDAGWAADVEWTAERDKLVRACLRQHGVQMPSVIVGECNREVGGWQKLMIAQDMIDAVRILNADDVENPGLLVRFYFTLSPYQQWTEYDYSSIIDQMAEIQKAGPTVAVPVKQIVEGVIRVEPPIDFRQLSGTTDCWCENIRRFFSRYGMLLDLDTVFQAGKGYARPAEGEPATFPTFLHAVRTLAQSEGVGLDGDVSVNGTLQQLEIDTFSTLWATLQDADTANPWTVVVGENNADLNPAQPWQHYGSLLQNPTNSDQIQWFDPAAPWDGDAAVYTKEQFTRAIQDNWDPRVIGYALKIRK